MQETIIFYASAPFRRLFDIADQFNIWSLAGALVFAALWYAFKRPRRALPRARAFFASAFPREYLANPSVRLDLKLFFVNSILMATGVFMQFVSGAKVSGLVEGGLGRLFGPSPFLTQGGFALSAAMSLGYLLLLDLAYWIAHWIMHRHPAFWEFHKLHHSAEVLTPLTEWRQHPVELLLFPVSISIVLGAFYGIMGHLFGETAQPFTWLGLNVVVMAFMFTTLHLRHSHLWLTGPRWLGYIIQSPAHHQIHHSDQPVHFDTNLGLFLSVWDWAFGTLHIPAEHEILNFGIGEEGHSHDGVFNAYWLPLLKFWRHAAPPRLAKAEEPPVLNRA